MTAIKLGLATAIFSTITATVLAADGEGARIAAAADKAIRPVMREHQVPGVAVAVTVDGRHYFMNYGVASKETNAPVTENTLFELGSISKTFAATLASYAQALGKLSFEDHPGKYMPALSGSAIDNASLLHLATYTAGGLPLQFPGAVKNDADMVSYFSTWKPDAKPGKKRRYSNPSIGLFGHTAALAMGGSFGDALETELFPKLGLKHSYVTVPKDAMSSYAWGYGKADRPIRVNPGVFDAEAYGVKSSAADMIRFVEANIDPGPFDGTVRRAIEGTHIGYFDSGKMVQGLGWEQYSYPVSLERLLDGNSRTMALDAHSVKALDPPRLADGATLYNKTGSTNGFGGYVAFVPEKKVGIVLLANRNFPIPERIKAAYAILETLAASAQ
ncbi:MULTISPECIES: class C beta-lactamase [unclassified Ensifer]|nr:MULTISPECIES: class C beta-lactamase [unclassified Ensifer]OCO98244.1 class C beta-lactamase [Ensifer sp. LC13]OCP05125.1 class C beta-lactamase [Ensifer sp. LC14]OCP14477.1 class C beta-lactamase [Ensifer sp. LC11]OCP29137.1 class C beta-lactamase [Ensifer sp. LC499]